MPTESELKFRVARKSLSTLEKKRRLPGADGKAASKQKLTSIYYDTPQHNLQREGLALRVRRTNGAYIQAVKSTQPDSFARGEWETKVEDNRPDLKKLKDSPFRTFAKNKLRHELRPVFRTSVKRVTRTINFGHSKVEMALDTGKIVAGKRSIPISEFELELKEGHAKDLFRLAAYFEQNVSAEMDLRSKSQRGYQLLEGCTTGAVFGEPITLNENMTIGEAFKTIAYSTARHFSSNVEPIRHQDLEGVHQMRVGLRRLRAALSLFKVVLPKASANQIKAELKWLTNELAPARELDVFIKEQLGPRLNDAPSKRGTKALLQTFQAQRSAAVKRVEEALNSSRFRRLLISLFEWIETNRSADEGHERKLSDFVSDVLHRRIRKIRKWGKKAHEFSPRERHKLRLRVKKVHYALAFFENLFHGKQQSAALKKALSSLKDMQSALGTLNDFRAHRRMALSAALKAPQENRRARAFTAGLVLGDQKAVAQSLVKKVRESSKRLHFARHSL